LWQLMPWDEGNGGLRLERRLS